MFHTFCVNKLCDSCFACFPWISKTMKNATTRNCHGNMKMYKLSLRNKYNPLWNKRIPQKRWRRCIRETRSATSLSEISMTWSPLISRSSPSIINSAMLCISLSAQHRVENTFGPSSNQVCLHEPSGWRASRTQRSRRCRACSTERNSDVRLRRWRRKCRVSLDIAGSLSRVRAGSWIWAQQVFRIKCLGNQGNPITAKHYSYITHRSVMI